MSQMPSNREQQELLPPSATPYPDEVVEETMRSQGLNDRAAAMRHLENASQEQEEAEAAGKRLPTDGLVPVSPEIAALGPADIPQIGAPSAAEEMRYEREREKEEAVEEFSDRALGDGFARSLYEQPATDFLRTWVYQFSEFYSNGTPWAQAIADQPFGNIPAGIGQGIRNASINTVNLILSTGGWDLEALPNPKETAVDYGDNALAGQFAEGMSQFATGFLAAGGPTTKLLGIGGTGRLILGSAISGAYADATVWDPRNGNVSTVLREMFPGSVYDEYLEAFDSRQAYQETGSQLHARFLSAAEGALIGEVAAPLMLKPTFLLLGGLVHAGRGHVRTVRSLGEGLSEGLRIRRLEQEGYLERMFGGPMGPGNPTGLPWLMDTPASRELAKEISQLTARYAARNARATVIATQNPQMSVLEIATMVDSELPPLPGNMDDGEATLEAFARATHEAIQAGPLGNRVTLDEVRAMVRFADPNRTYLITDNLPSEADTVLYQSTKDDRAAFERLDRAERTQGPGHLNADIRSRIAELRDRHGLTPKDVKFIEARIKETLKDFPLSEWEKLDVEFIFPAEKNGKGERIAGTSILRRDKAGNPTIDLRFRTNTYSWASENPKDVNSPVIDRENNPSAWTRRTNSLARKLVDEVLETAGRTDEGGKTIMAARGWYETMRQRLRREFGNLHRLFAEMLGATSPQTAVGQNFRFTVDIIQNYSRGTYDRLLDDYIEFRNAGGTFEQWKQGNNPIIFQNGVIGPADKKGDAFKRFGANGGLVMDTLAGHWLNARYSRPVLDPEEILSYGERGLIVPADLGLKGKKDSPEFLQALENLKAAWIRREQGFELSAEDVRLLSAVETLEVRAAQEAVAGGSPKAFNFASNLMGTTRAATIDVWAARTLNRLSGARRLPPPSEQAVVGNFMTLPQVGRMGGDVRDDAGATTSAFGMGQQVMEIAARELREMPAERFKELGYDENPFADMRPDDLQALVWFREKEQWASRGYTNDAGAGGSFDYETDKYLGPTSTVLGRDGRPGMQYFETDMAADMITDMPGRVGVSTPTVIDVSTATRLSDEVLGQDGTIMSYSALDTTGLPGVTPFYIEMTLGRQFGKADRYRPVDPENVERLTSGELERVDVGRSKDAIRDVETGEVLPRQRTVPDIDPDTGQQRVDKEGNLLTKKVPVSKKQVEYPLEAEPTMASPLALAARLHQESGEDVLVHRYLQLDEIDAAGNVVEIPLDEFLARNPNARPMVEVFFDEARSGDDIAEFLAYAKANNLHVEAISAATPGARTAEREAITGLRFIDVPELSASGAAIRAADDPAAAMRARFDEFDGFGKDLARMDGVAEIDSQAVDTMLVGNRGINPEEIIDAEGNVRDVAEAAWTGRPWYESPEGVAREAVEGADGPAGSTRRPGAEGPDPAPEAGADLGPDTTLYQAARGPSTELTARGAAVVDQEEGIAMIKFFRTADRTTAVHEMGHAIRVTQMGPRAKAGQGVLTADQIDAVEKLYGVKDGRWTRRQEERFADEFMAYMLEGGPRSDSSLPPRIREAFDFAAAALRDVANDQMLGTVPVSREVTEILDQLNKVRGLPVRYAPYRYVRVADFDSVIRKITEADERGDDIMSVIEPEDILGTTRTDVSGNPRMANRFDASTPEDALKLIAHFNAFTRDLLEADVLMRPRSRDQMVREALESVNGLMGRDMENIDETMGELLAGVDMRETGRQALDQRVMAANMLLTMKAERLVKLAEAARESMNPLDIAKMHRAALEYQVVQAAVSASSTNWGRAGHAMQNVKLPDPDELANPKVADEFLRGIGMKPGSLVSDSETMMNGLAMVEIPRDNFAVGKILRNEIEQVGAMRRSVDIAKEYFVNNLLSGPKTWFTLSVFSPILNMTLDSSMRFAGGAIMAAMGDRRGYTQIRREAENLREMILQAGISFEYALRAFRQERGVLMPGTELYDAPNGHVAIRSESDNAVARHLINGTGNVVRGPSRAIMTFDEFFRQLNGRVHLISRFSARVEDEFIKSAINSGELTATPTPIQIDAFLMANKDRMRDEVMRRVDETISDGRIRDQTEIVREALADPEISAIDDDLARALAVREYYNDQWTQTHARNVAYTRDYATRAVFQGELEGIGAGIQRGLDSFGGVLRFVVPFFRTPWNIQEKFFGLMPTNILAEMMSRSLEATRGRGFNLPEMGRLVPNTSNLGAFHRKHLEDLASGNPRRVAEARGRQAAGIAITATVMSLAEEGLITGAGPLNPDERDVWWHSGWRPYSFKKPDGTYVSYVGWDPVAQYLAMAADTHQLMNAEDGYYTDDEQVNLWQATVMTFASQMGEKSYIQGIAQLLDLLDKRKADRGLERFTNSLALGFVPFSAAQQQFRAAVDPVVREHRDVLDFLNARTFLGDNENVPPRYNFLGEPVRPATESTAPVWNWVNRVNVSKVSQETDDPVMLEIYRSGAVPTRIRPIKDRQDLRDIPASDGVHSAFVEWQRNVALVRHPGSGLTLREHLEELIADPIYEARRNDEPDPVSEKTENQRAIIRAINLYKALAWQATLAANPALRARMNQVAIDQATVNAANREDAFGPQSDAAVDARQALDALVEDLEAYEAEGGESREATLQELTGGS